MRKAAVLLPIPCLALALAGCGSGASSPQANAVSAGASPPGSAAPSQTLVADGALPVTGGPAPGPYSYEPALGPLTSLERRTAGPVALRLYTGSNPGQGSCDPYNASCVPTWCEPTSVVVAELSTEAIAVRRTAGGIGVGPDTSLSLLDYSAQGLSEGKPVQLALVSTTDRVRRLTLQTADGTDTSVPVKGVAALAVQGSETAGSLTAYDGSNRVLQRVTLPAPMTAASAACAEQPQKLPVAGEQPADRAAAEKQVRAAFDNAFTHAPPGGDIYHGLNTVVDGEKLRKSVDQVRSNFPEAFDTITVTTGDLVFVDPRTAVVQYTPTYTGGAPAGPSNGTAVLVGGKWLVTQGTYCSLLRFGGATCPPAPSPGAG